MAENKLLNGVRLFKPRDNAPDFVIASGVITPDDLVAFCNENPDLMSEYQGKQQIRIQVLRSRAGDPYIAVDAWKPNTEAGQPNAATQKAAEDLPF